MRAHRRWVGLALLIVLVIVFALFAVAAAAESGSERSAPGTTVPISRTTSTTLPPRPTTTTTTIPPRTTTTLATTTTAAATTTTTAAPAPSTTTTVAETTTTTVVPPTITSPAPEPPPPPLTPTCQIFVWWGNGSLEPAVDPAYQNPASDAGHLNVFGSGYVPGESVHLLIDGTHSAVVGDGPPHADETGRFLANGPNTGGMMSFIEGLPVPFELTAQGNECSSTVTWGIEEPVLEVAEEQSFSVLPWVLVLLGGALGALAVYLWRRNR